MLAFVTAAALWRRQHAGGAARIDFSMIEAMLWTMAEPVLATQLDVPPMPQGNRSGRYVPHGAYRCAGEDDWISVAVRTDEEWCRLCAMVPALGQITGLGFGERVERCAAIEDSLAAWFRGQNVETATARLLHAGIPAASLVSSTNLVTSGHLRERGFWEPHGGGVLPGMPWRASFGRCSGPAPGLGADTDLILRDVLDLSPDEIEALRRSGALG